MMQQNPNCNPSLWAHRFCTPPTVSWLCLNGLRQTLRCNQFRHWWVCCHCHLDDLSGRKSSRRCGHGRRSMQSQRSCVSWLRTWWRLKMWCSWKEMIHSSWELGVLILMKSRGVSHAPSIHRTGFLVVLGARRQCRSRLYVVCTCWSSLGTNSCSSCPA